MLITQSACASSSIEIRLMKNHKTIDKEFQPYIQEFQYASLGAVNEKDFKRFTMGFRDMDYSSSTVGVCHPLAYEVDISRSWWHLNTSQSKRIELVFHELAHCVLRRGHTQKPIGDSWMHRWERFGFAIGMFAEKAKLPDGCPSSFMHPYTLTEDCIDKHFSYYIEELFGRKRINYVSRNPSHELVCKKQPKVINETKTWTKSDSDTLYRAKMRCVKSYHSCLKTFWKKGHGRYHALCE